MMILPSRLPGLGFAQPARLVALCVAGSLVVAGATWAQAPAPNPPAAEPPTPAQPTPAPEPVTPATPVAPQSETGTATPPAAGSGLIDAVGRMFESSVTTARDAIGGIGTQADSVARGAADAAGTMAKGAADAVNNVGRLPTSLIARGREQCQLAANGAPDCRTAAEALCRANGLSGGNSIDFQTTEKCPVQVLASGERVATGVCVTEHFVTRSLCQ